MFPPTKCKGALPCTVTETDLFRLLGTDSAPEPHCGSVFFTLVSLRPSSLIGCNDHFIIFYINLVANCAYDAISFFLLSRSPPTSSQISRQMPFRGWLLLCSCKKMFITCWRIFFWWLLKDLLLIKVDWCLLLGSRLLFCSVYLLDMKMYRISLETQPGGTVRRLAV